jgi:ribosomal protein S18 acetylase RimI-like enzyme
MSETSTPSPTIIVRPAVPADAAALGKLGALLLSLHHDLDPGRFIGPDKDTPKLYADFLYMERQRGDAIVLVAEDAGKVLGYAYAAMEGADFMALRGPAGVLHDLVVDPKHRGHGIGRMLIDAIRANVASRGAPRLVLSAAARNRSAQALFEALGFRSTMIEMTLDL